MVQSKTLLFIGRTDPDTGYKICVDFANAQDLKLVTITNEPDITKFIATCDYVFASGYLTILEAMAAGKLVFAAYSNPLRHDYLLLHPQSSNMIIGESVAELSHRLASLSAPQTAKMIASARAWAKLQTWDRLAQTYLTLWQSK